MDALGGVAFQDHFLFPIELCDRIVGMVSFEKSHKELRANCKGRTHVESSSYMPASGCTGVTDHATQIRFKTGVQLYRSVSA
jgi:hypothetical protein